MRTGMTLVRLVGSAAVLLTAAVGCGSNSGRDAATPSLATLIPDGSIVVSTSGVGSEDLGTFTVKSSPVDVDIQGTCVGTGQVKISVDTGDGTFRSGPVCLSKTDKSASGLTAGDTINHVPIPDHRVRVRVTADRSSRWAIAVSTPDA